MHTRMQPPKQSLLGLLLSPIAIVVEFLILCGRPQRLAAQSQGDGAPSPFETATVTQRVYFMWANALISKAAVSGTPVQLSDLWAVHTKISLADSQEDLAARWSSELEGARRPSLLRAMFASVRHAIATTFTFKMGWLLFSLISNALLLRLLLQFLQNQNQPLWVGILIALSFLVSEALRSVCVNQHWLTAVLAGIRLRAAARGLLYDKLLRLRIDAVGSIGTAVNLLTNDSQRLCDAVSYGEFLLSTPPVLVATLGVMIGVLGPSALVGFVLLLLCAPLQARLGSWVGDVRRTTIVITDERARLMSEILLGIRLIKLNGWESAFAARVAAVRAREVASLTRAAIIRAINTLVVSSVPILVTLATFATYTMTSGNNLDAGSAFVVISVFNVARFPLGLLPLAVRNVSEARVAAARMQAFLELPEVEAEDCPIPLPLGVEHGGGGKGGRKEEEEGMGSAQSPGQPMGDTQLSRDTLLLTSLSSTGRQAAAAASLLERTGDGALPPENVVVLARGASFVWPSPPPPLSSSGRGSTDIKGAARTSSSCSSGRGPSYFRGAISRLLHKGGAGSVDSGGTHSGLGAGAECDPAVSSAPPATAAAAPTAAAPAVPFSGSKNPSDFSAVLVRQPSTPSPSSPTAPITLPQHAPAAPDAGGICDVSFSLARGQVALVTGPVGCGKSSLLAAMLGHLRRTRGAFAVRGRVAYCAQSPWIFSGSLLDNILFGRPFDQARYDDVVDACALRPDLALLPAGDATEIGEKGLNLSGGQKARVALARAVYSDADVLLLDDPLSAVDTYVSRVLWRCIQGAARRGATVICATHQTQYLPEADLVLLMAPGGRVAASGTYAQLGAAAGGAAETLLLGLRELRLPSDEEADDAPEVAPASAVQPVGAREAAGASAPLASAGSSKAADAERPLAIVAGEGTGAEARIVPAPSSGGTDSVPPSASMPNPSYTLPAPQPAPVDNLAPQPGSLGQPAGASLVVAEDRSSGSVSLLTLKKYLSAASGGWLVPAYLLLILLLSKGSLQVSTWWVANWTSSAGSGSAHNQALQQWYLSIYAATAAAVLLFTLLQGVSFGVITLHSSRRLHDVVFSSVLRATSAWFDTQPTGRILARFTGDVDTVDTALPQSLEQSAEYLTQCALAIVIICVFIPWFALCAVPIIFVFATIARFFRKAVRELKRLDSIARSPLVTCVSASIGGLATIRAFQQEGRYRSSLFRQAVDNNTRTFWAFYASNRWVAIRLDWTTTVVAFVIAILCVANRDTLAPGVAGLVLTQGLLMAGILQFATRLVTECEASLTSVERLEYLAGAAVPHELLVARIGSGGSDDGSSVRENDAGALKHLAATRAAAFAAAIRAVEADAAAATASGSERVLKDGAAPSTADPLIIGSSDNGCVVVTLAPAASVVAAAGATVGRASRLVACCAAFGPSRSDTEGLIPGLENDDDEDGSSSGALMLARRPGWDPVTWNPSLVAAHWPRRGALRFENVCMRYRAGLPLVLRNLSFEVQPGHVVCVVGRTGAGKTSLLAALFRTTELASGCVSIDGVDTSSVNVYHLRSRLAVIPQDPTLFTGTLRRNVDALGDFSDEAVWSALDSAGLGPFARGSPLGLERPIADGGANISTGERQLVCLARALLRNARVVCLDEATASTDAHTDHQIGLAVRERMSGATLLVIAHRLHACMGADRCLVMDRGAAIEYDTPAALLGLGPPQERGTGGVGPWDGEGALAALVRNTGPETAALLRCMAARAEEARRLKAAAEEVRG